MRFLAALVLFPLPAAAWEAYTDGPVCVLAHDTETSRTEVTHDPRRALPYAIDITLVGTTWTQGDTFAIRFEGPRDLTISTDRHQLSRDQSSLSVADTGFGNVLNGIEFNDTARALLAGQSVAIPLTNAAPAVQKFRDCAERIGA